MNLISYEESVKDLVKEIKQKRDGWRNLKNAYVNYSEYVSEQIDKSMSYTEYVADNLSSIISYSEYLSEKIK
jgi:iron uptake system EfeUOB component EfeO/EfeM